MTVATDRAGLQVMRISSLGPEDGGIAKPRRAPLKVVQTHHRHACRALAKARGGSPGLPPCLRVAPPIHCTAHVVLLM